MELRLDPELTISMLSLIVTCYFWMIRSRRERPNLEFVQLSDFRSSCRRIHDRDDAKRYCLQTIDSGSVLIVNHSIRQNSIVLFECYLPTESGVIRGDWGYGGDDKPPWNVGPETTIAFSPACFFDVPPDFVEPENPVFYIRFLTASGRKFTKRFSKHIEQLNTDEPFRIQDAA